MLEEIDRNIQIAEIKLKLIIDECTLIQEIGIDTSQCLNDLENFKHKMDNNPSLALYRQTGGLIVQDNIDILNNQLNAISIKVDELSVQHASRKVFLKAKKYNAIIESLNKITVSEQAKPDFTTIINQLKLELESIQSSNRIEDLQCLHEISVATQAAEDILLKIKSIEQLAPQFKESVKIATATLLRQSFQLSTLQEKETVKTRLVQIYTIVDNIASPQFSNVLATANVMQLLPYEQQCIANLKKKRIDDLQESIRNYVITRYKGFERSEIFYNEETYKIENARHGSISIFGAPPSSSNIFHKLIIFACIAVVVSCMILSLLLLLASFALPFVLIGAWGIMTAGLLVLHPIFLLYYITFSAFLGLSLAGLTGLVELFTAIAVAHIVVATVRFIDYLFGKISFLLPLAKPEKDWEQLKTTAQELKALNRLDLDSVSLYVKPDDIPFPILETAKLMKAVVDQANQCHPSVLRAAKTPPKSNGHAFFTPVCEQKGKQDSVKGASESSYHDDYNDTNPKESITSAKGPN